MASAKSVTVALRSGVSSATLPNGITLKAGKNVAISLEDWAKISQRARDTVVTGVVNTSGSIVPLADSATASTSDYALQLTDINNYSTIALLNADAQAAKDFVLGDVVRGFKDAAFKLVLVDTSSTAIAAGDVVVWGGASVTPAVAKRNNRVTGDFSDVTDQSGQTLQFAGVSIGTITANQYGWIQVAGTYEGAKVETNVAAGDSLQVSENTDETLTSATNEVQTLVLTSWDSTDTIKLTFNAVESGAVTYSATPATNATNFQAALIALAAFDTGDVVVTATDINTYVFTFGGNYAYTDVGALTATSGTGSAAGTFTETTKGNGTASGVTMGTALSSESGGVADVEIRSALARNLRSRQTDIFRDARN